MTDKTLSTSADPSSSAGVAAPRRRRADAQRNVDALLEAAKAVFAISGVDAPAKEITDRAGLGVGTLYRHFPQRSDLVAAVLEREIDACAEAGPALAAAHEPVEALAKWLYRLTEFVGTKRGLATAIHSGDPKFDDLAEHLMKRLEPVLGGLIDAAVATGEARADVGARELLHAVALLCQPVPGEALAYNQRLVSVLLDGLRRR
ncbi:TetR/AcrR family transcriptional regulator [Nocardia miyunensis]|uniref:TetR/AcrR family transcriptional regulator n=1 Tax=Nocardia miyunensis TaxID=282684 RepID=UPI000AD2D95A|nr:TetR/AcrR family transcriptional regulator [Nocardia miyunensis]